MHPLLHNHLLILVLLLVLTTPAIAVSQEAASLLTLKTFLDPSNTLHYTLTEPLDYCHWQGVKCEGNFITHLTLPSSSLSGSFPSHFPSFPRLRSVLLPNNSLSGPIPNSLPRSLRHLDLSFNILSGHLPHRLPRLSFLVSCFLQFNHFSGPLPLLNQSSLIFLNVSGNNFSGEVPLVYSKFSFSSFLLNPNLCGQVVHKPCVSQSPLLDSSAATSNNHSASTPVPLSRPSNHHKTVFILAFSFAGMILLSSFICLFLTTTANTQTASCNNDNDSDTVRTSSPDVIEKTYFSTAAGEVEEVGPEVIRVRLDTETNELRDNVGPGKTREKSGKLVFSEGEEGGMYTLEQLMKASAEMLGRGTVGTTYKAKLDDRLIVTVKRLDAVRMSGVDGEVFERHMEVVGRLRHPNLVAVKAWFQARDERLIIFEYQPNGSVFSLIHGSRSTRAKPLHWTSCLKIAEDVAQGLAYIHQASKLIHGNLKASNVLLGADFEACLTDYCLSTLAESSQIQDTDPDSARYKGPEARQPGRRATHKSDVYAFGVLLLELVSGKLPSQHPFLAPPDMADWVKAVRGVDDGFEESQLGMLVDVATLCSSTSPEQRPTMWQVLKMIQRIKASVGPDDDIDTSTGYA